MNLRPIAVTFALLTLTAWAQVGGGGSGITPNPTQELILGGASAAAQPAPAGQPQVVTTTTTSWVAKTLRNMDELMLQINLLRNQRFNTTLNDTDIVVLNNRVYPFAWQNGLFTRLPFPNNITFYDCDGIKPEIARVVTPLKNRFQVRPVNLTQMSCPLHLRVIENNHYEGKFTRTVLEFTSPCLDFPVYKYIMNKTGLRQNLRLRILGVDLTFQFRGVSFIRGRTRVQAYQEYRLLKPHHHPMVVPNQKYKKDNITDSSALYRGSLLSPTQQMALQAESLMLLQENYEKQMGIFNMTEQTDNFKPRNEIFPRKAKQASGKGRKAAQKAEKESPKAAEDDSPLRHPHFRWRQSTVRKTRTILQKLVGSQNFPRLRKMLWQSLQQDIIAKVMAAKEDPKSPKKQNKKSRRLSKKHIRTPSGRRLEEKGSSKKRASRGSRAHRRKLQMPYTEPWVLDHCRHLIRGILANEPYKVDTCQRICTAESYYPSWNFCLRVCGIKYNFLSNIQDDTSSLNLYPRVPFIRIARERVFVHAGLPQNAQFTFDQLQQLKNSEDVRTCTKTWRTFICEWSV